MTREDFDKGVQKIGGSKRAIGIVAAGCLIPLVLICGLLAGGVGWIRGSIISDPQPPVWARYEPYQAITEVVDCDGVGEVVIKLPRGGYACSIDRDSFPYVEDLR